MKTVCSLFTLLMLAMPALSFAQGSGHTGGSLCEIAINDIRIDLIGWIEGGGSKVLKSKLLTLGMSVDAYNSAMTNALLDPSTIVSCPDPKKQNKARPVSSTAIFVDGKQKTCENWRDRQGIQHIVCDYNQFYFGKPQDQYKLIHHEFASLKGVEIEKRLGSESDYLISTLVQKSVKPSVLYHLSVRDRIVNFNVVKGMNPVTRLLIGFISDSLRADFNDLEHVSNRYSSAQLIQMQGIQNLLNQPNSNIRDLALYQGNTITQAGRQIHVVWVFDRLANRALFKVTVIESEGYNGSRSTYRIADILIR